MSLRTGGYRFPSCSTDFTDIFTLMSQKVISGSKVPCSFEIPEPENGLTIDLDTVQMRYTTGDQAPSTLSRALSAENCDAQSFLINAESRTVGLCPAACERISADPQISQPPNPVRLRA